MTLNTGYDKLTEMTIFELLDMCDDLKEIQREVKREAKKKARTR